ncbi:pyridoxal phosphate-dependent aminotransferase [Xylophilus sp. GOD-11R]|uniref:pyridoxal phosphate-dependent aminotransferase n=1 Tax=Xylophilus sp. GOD-11R TaxID=3089814 RepID=UPI00298D0F7A|nr:pyridoxal phosphate-dependent aminotransferase [Xylophilus sp. GOD-11R]WPB59434.1 pyridoxal phosphate-dependent aminotransferase [Xylophilus sp. GOD-11R]
MRLSGRAQRITPFYVMEVAKAAAARTRELADTDRPMIFLNVGEPDFTAPPLVQEAAARAVHGGTTQYTPSLGIMPLRERLSHWYAERFGVDVPARRIVVTAGASAALQLACLTLIDAGDEILMPDPSYPCNRQFVSAAEGRAVLLPTTAADRYQLSADQVAAAWGPNTRGVLLASPSNPTGTSIAPDELRRIHAVVRERGGVLLLDEIYLGLSYDDTFGQSVLALDGAESDVISINSFSKYFHMTGWRLGWMVVPDALVPVIDKLAAHLFICPSTVAQHAALACFEPDSIAEYEHRRNAFKARRDFFVPALAAAGLPVPVVPDGAFYAWADCSEACRRLGVADSWELSFALMEQAHLAVTPGRDFGNADTAMRIRFSTANSMAQLQEAAGRLQALLG